MPDRPPTDAELRFDLKLIDNSPSIEVDRYEADFLESVLVKGKDKDLTPNQRAFAQKMIDKYQP